MYQPRADKIYPDHAEEEDQPYRETLPVAAVGCNVGRDLAALEDIVHGPHACNHTAVVVAVAERWQHTLHLNAFAQGIRQNTLDAVTRHETDLVPSFDKQYANAVVITAANAPIREEAVGEVENIVTVDLAHGNHGHLRNATLTQIEAQGVNRGYGRSTEHTVGIRREARAVGKLHVGYLSRRVSFGPNRNTRHGEHKYKDYFLHIKFRFRYRHAADTSPTPTKTNACGGGSYTTTAACHAPRARAADTLLPSWH